MPRGSYRVAGRVEAFSCAPGPAGWRYLSDRLDLACDSGFRPVRFEVRTPSAGSLRGGGARLDDGTPVLVWVGPDGRERHAAAQVLLTGSPGSWVAAVQFARATGRTDTALVSLTVDLSGDGLGAVRERHRSRLVGSTAHDTDGDPLIVQEWWLDDLGSGRRRVLHLAGDVLVAAEGVPEPGDAVEVVELESPPSAGGGR